MKLPQEPGKGASFSVTGNRNFEIMWKALSLPSPPTLSFTPEKDWVWSYHKQYENYVNYN